MKDIRSNNWTVSLRWRR